MANDLKYKGFTGSAECSVEDVCLHGKVLFIDDLITYEGETVTEIKAAFEAAIDRYLAYCEKTGKPANRPYSGSFNVRVGADLHRHAAECAQRTGVKLNEFVVNAIKKAVDVSCAVPIQHHHRHDVTVTIQGKDSTMLDLVSSTSQKPSGWQSIPNSRLN